jgi:hypothetical protein
MSRPQEGLFNEKCCSDSEYDEKLFEQYKMYVELTDRISQRRATANSFFISANAALLTIASWFKEDFGNYIYLISVAGIAISLFWFFGIRSYKQLNAGKFKVIHEIEKHLPMNLFSHEWKSLGKGESRKEYWPLSHVELKIPFVFVVLYLALAVFIFCNF